MGDLVVIAPARRAGDPGSNPGPGENFSLKMLKYIYIYIYRGYVMKLTHLGKGEKIINSYNHPIILIDTRISDFKITDS